MSEKQEQKLEQEIDRVESSRLEENRTVYLSDIEADIDRGMVDLVEYFNDTVNHPTIYCCLRLLKDHYDLEELQQILISEVSRLT